MREWGVLRKVSVVYQTIVATWGTPWAVELLLLVYRYVSCCLSVSATLQPKVLVLTSSLQKVLVSTSSLQKVLVATSSLQKVLVATSSLQKVLVATSSLHAKHGRRVDCVAKTAA